ncbi:MAG TPA: hypothetical protein VMS56_08630 [Thermoanaerobaculia bacterium]|nr:hypothetical protein [Thermoanaerobaculia bacterium]
MVRRSGFLVSILMVVLAVPALAQERDRRPPRPDAVRPPDPSTPLFEWWLRGQGLLFGNFFQATESEAEEDVAALLGEVGMSVDLRRGFPLRAYGSVNYLRYDDEVLDSSHGLRVGVRSDGRPHAFDVYVDGQRDRPTFDVGDVFARADVTRLAGEYSYRVTREWQVTVDGELEQQEFDLTPLRDNEFAGLGVAVRYRGWDFSPEIAYKAGTREVDDPTQSYDQTDFHLQVRSSLTPRVYMSVRLRSREREYRTDQMTSSNFGRADDRIQLSGYLDIRLLGPLALNLYGSWEDVDSNLEGRDFASTLLAAGLTWRF